MTTVPACSKCSGRFVCSNCQRTLRAEMAARPRSDSLLLNAAEFSGVHHHFDEAKMRALYTTTFPIGPRGGALIDFGNAIVLECHLPYKEPGGLVLPFMPYPFTGREIVHDIGRKREVRPWELDACAGGYCRCSTRPTGWRITRPIARALLCVTDSWLNDHGRQLPGIISSSWALAYHTPVFMRQLYFANFLVPTREESRDARARRARSRSSARWTRTHPEHTHRRRRR